MEKVVYLFGAGASNEVLPLNNQIAARLTGFIGILDSFFYNSAPSHPLYILKEKLKFDLEWLMKETSRHASIDTYAKKLFLKRRENDLRRLKLAFSVFLIYEQIGKPAGKRYDAFFASLLSTGLMLPAEIKILNWNYDHQFELSFSEFTDTSDLAANGELLHSINKFSSYRRGIQDQFTIFKLNGDCSLDKLNTPYKRTSWEVEFMNEFDFETCNRLLNKWDQVRNSQEYASNISFAWEKESESSSMIEEAKNAITSAEILVVIGYSFPYFNRDTDRMLIRSMKSLKKVYFQAPNPEDLMDRFNAILADPSIKKVPFKDTLQFLIPDEL